MIEKGVYAGIMSGGGEAVCGMPIGSLLTRFTLNEVGCGGCLKSGPAG